MNWSAILSMPVTKRENDLLNRQAEYFRKDFKRKDAASKFRDSVNEFRSEGLTIDRPLLMKKKK